MNQELNINIIGLGGIGSVLSDSISRFLNYKPTSSIYKVTLVDGDSYETKNHERQTFVVEGSNKAETKKKELKEKYRNIIFSSIPKFVTQENISQIIKEESINILCVDNHKTRKVVSDYCSKLNNITLISGGNEITEGNVQIFAKKNGEKLLPSLTDYHQEIDNPQDKSPEEKSCQELQQSEPQLYFTNLMASCFICCALYNVMNGNYQYSEVYFDVSKMKADSKIRKVKEQKRSVKEVLSESIPLQNS
jgi:molybdopterin/thiamine biosynthesis adenylyltransferase